MSHASIEEALRESSAYRRYAEDGTKGACRENVKRFLEELHQLGYELSNLKVLVLWDPTREPSPQHCFRVNHAMLRSEESQEGKQYGEQ